MKTYEMLAELFLREGVTTCFALLGDANMNWATSLAAGGAEFIYTRDEHCAVAAAMAYARTRDTVSVATVTCGPGLTQITTALPAAVRAGLPMVIFAGEAPLRKAWYNQAINQAPIVEACGARYVRLTQSGEEYESMAVEVRDAFQFARDNSCPVVLGVPLDIQEDQLGEQPVLPEPSVNALADAVVSGPDEGQLQSAAKLVSNARKIVVLAGLGAIKADAGEACSKLAQTLNALLATTLPARGLFWQDPYYLGVAGGFSSETARKYLQQADLIIAVGTRLASQCSDAGKLWSAESVLHIDLQPLETSQGLPAAKHHLQSDALAGVEALLQRVSSDIANDSDDGTAEEWRCEAVAEEISSAAPDSWKIDIEPGLFDPRDIVSTLEKVLPTDWHMVNSSGHCSYYPAQMYRRPANRFFTLREFGAIGNGLAFALGVAAADRDNPVVLFDGDGSFLMHIQELETIARSGLKVLVIVFNDGAYGSEIHKLRAEGLPDDGGMFGRPQFDAIANGFGLSGKKITDLDTINRDVEEFAAGNTAAVWDFHISDRVISPVMRRSHHYDS